MELYLETDLSGQVRATTSLSGTEGVAQIRRVGDRVFVRAMVEEPAVSVNEWTAQVDDWQELKAQDALAVAGITPELPPELFLPRPRWDLVARDLEFRLSSEQTLVQKTDVCIRQARLTAIMGPAGCGKSTLIKCLNGYLKPNSGKAALVRQGAHPLDLHCRSGVTNELLGYVPQESVLLPDLTVGYSLDCRLALKYPDMPADLRARIAESALHQLGFDRGRQTREFMQKRVAVLSGGENRRANIAHELVLQPMILLLDEPTSGVSAPDAEKIVKCLKSLSRERGIAVAAVIHQPSADVFAQFDDLILMNRHGRVVYHGPADKACGVLRAFDRKHGERVESANPAEYLLDLAYGASLNALADHMAFKREYGEILEMANSDGIGAPSARCGISSTFVNCIQRLVRRSLRGFINDRFTIGAAFGQAPLIALLIIFAFFGFTRDWSDDDIYARYVANFQSAYEKVLNLEVPVHVRNDSAKLDEWGRGLPEWEELHNEAARAAIAESDRGRPRISGQHATQRGAVYFMLAASAIWFGILGASREVVCELPLLRREVRTGVPLGAWLGAKLLAQSVIVGIQCALLAGLVVPCLLGGSGVPIGLAWLLMWSAGITGVCLGLLVSAIAPSYRVALTLVPLLMIPQFLFGGLLRSEERMGAAGRWMSSITLQRWGFESFCRQDPYAHSDVLQSQTESVPELSPPPENGMRSLQYRLWFTTALDNHFSAERHPLSSMVRFDETGLIALNLGKAGANRPDRLPQAIQFIMSAMALIVCAGIVRRKA